MGGLQRALQVVQWATVRLDVDGEGDAGDGMGGGAAGDVDGEGAAGDVTGDGDTGDADGEGVACDATGGGREGAVGDAPGHGLVMPMAWVLPVM